MVMVMDYEKKYKEALERARKCLDEKRDTCFVRPDVIFPELKESEDERIRKEIFHFVLENTLSTDMRQHRWLAWLEKQGEQKEYTFKSLPRLLDMIEPTSKAKAYCQKLIDALVKEGYATDAKIVGECLKIMNGDNVPMAIMDEKQGKLKWTEEEIRETQLDYWRSVGGKEWHGVPVQETIAWLEKQKPDTYDELPQCPHKYNQGDWIVSKLGEIYQIKEVLKGSYNLLCKSGAEEINSISIVDSTSRLLIMHDIVEKQKPTEWSEEDEENFKRIVYHLKEGLQYNDKLYSKLCNWLKSLKLRMEEQQ